VSNAPSRLDPRPAPETDIRPIVARASAGLPLWVLIGGLGLAAILLFSVLDARRRAATAPSTKVRLTDANGIAAPITPLYIPPAPMPILVAPAPPPPVQLVPVVKPMSTPVPVSAPLMFAPPTLMSEPFSQARAQVAAPRTPVDAALVFDGSTALVPTAVDGAATPAGDGPVVVAAIGARASVTRHLPTLIPQGTLISAVLETALDSTRPGPVRALVSRDVRGFDGTRVLISRGSRLIGEYRADLEPGQNRALIMWTRLLRPDGVTIAIGSPVADTLGRVGVRGQVNSHFLERFASALLQSSLIVGENLASRAGNSTIVVATPGATQSLTSPLGSNVQIKPTLRVRQGAAITVFVARDLDFTAVESRR
jgi:type IV secretion system protein VirB10